MKNRYPKKAELRGKWWAEFLKQVPRPLKKTLGKTGLGNALTEYEIARDQLGTGRMSAALKDIHKKLPKAAKACFDAQDYDAKSLMQQYLLMMLPDSCHHTKSSSLAHAFQGSNCTGCSLPQWGHHQS